MNDLNLPIRRNRTANVAGTLSHQGIPVPHQEILVKQKNHKFLFGNNWGESNLALANDELSGTEKELAELRNELFLQLFNQATLP
jgi:endo-1,4-beta-xylanase